MGRSLFVNPRMFFSSGLVSHIFKKVEELLDVLISSPENWENFAKMGLMKLSDFWLALENLRTSSAYMRCKMDVSFYINEKIKNRISTQYTLIYPFEWNGYSFSSSHSLHLCYEHA